MENKRNKIKIEIKTSYSEKIKALVELYRKKIENIKKGKDTDWEAIKDVMNEINVSLEEYKKL